MYPIPTPGGQSSMAVHPRPNGKPPTARRVNAPAAWSGEPRRTGGNRHCWRIRPHPVQLSPRLCSFPKSELFQMPIAYLKMGSVQRRTRCGHKHRSQAGSPIPNEQTIHLLPPNPGFAYMPQGGVQISRCKRLLHPLFRPGVYAGERHSVRSE